MSTIVTYIVSTSTYANLGLQNYTSKCKPTNGHLKLQKQKYAKDMQKESWATGMYGKVSKILKPCQTFQFKDESSP